MRALLLLFPLLAVLHAAAQSSETFDLNRESASKIEVTSVFSAVPPSGFAPVQVRITNNTDSEITIPIASTSIANEAYGRGHSLTSSFSISAPPRKSTDRELIVPLCPSSSLANHSGSLVLSITTPLGTQSARFESGGNNEAPFAALSQSLARKNIRGINTYAQGHTSGSSRGDFAALFTASQLPSDWRGLSGVDSLSISSDEWSTLSPGASTAALQWVRLGGTLDFHQKAGASPPAPAEGRGYTPLGAGFIRVVEWDGDELEESAVYNSITGASAAGSRTTIGVRRVEAVQDMARPEPGLYLAMGTKNFAAEQVGIILLIFGIIVGPVNLFVFAPSGRRHRLFYTTPLISGAAALILLLVIYFQDGTGGKGCRASVVYLDAGDHNAYIHQQQLCRTGVLFSSGFTTEPAVNLTQGVLPDSRWTRFKSSSGSYSGPVESQSFSVKDNTFAGDWLQSRAEQAQIIDAIVPTRGRLELKPGSNPPVLISSLPATLGALYYLDSKGEIWTAPGRVSTGAEVILEKAESEKFEKWLSSRMDYTGGSYPLTLTGNAPRGHFYAVSSDPAAGIVDTCSSIEWAGTTVFLFGPIKQP